MKRIDFYRQRRIAQKTHWDALKDVLETRYSVATKSRQQALEATITLLQHGACSSQRDDDLSSIPGLLPLVQHVLRLRELRDSLLLRVEQEERELEGLRWSQQAYLQPPVSQELPWVDSTRVGSWDHYGWQYSGVHMYRNPSASSLYYDEPEKPAASFAAENSPRVFFFLIFMSHFMWNYGWQATDAPGIAETFTERALASTSTAVSSLSTTLLRLWAALWSLGVPHFLGALVAIVASYAFVLWLLNPWPRISKRRWRRALAELGKAKVSSQLHVEEMTAHLHNCLDFLGRPLPNSYVLLSLLILGALARLVAIALGFGSWLESRLIPNEHSRQAGALVIEVYQFGLRKYLWFDRPLLMLYMCLQALCLALAALPDSLAVVYAQVVLASFCMQGIPEYIVSVSKYFMFKWTIAYNTYRHYKYFYMLQAVAKLHRGEAEGTLDLIAKSRSLMKLENDHIKSVLEQMKNCPDPAVSMHSDPDYVSGDLIANVSDAAGTYILESCVAFHANDLDTATKALDMAEPLLVAAQDIFVACTWAQLRLLPMILTGHHDHAFLEWEQDLWNQAQHHHQIKYYPAMLSRLGTVALYHLQVLGDRARALDLALEAVHALDHLKLDIFVPAMSPVAVPLFVDVLIDEVVRLRAIASGETATLRAFETMVAASVAKFEAMLPTVPLLAISCLRLRAWLHNEHGDTASAAQCLRRAWKMLPGSFLSMFQQQRIEAINSVVFGHLNDWVPWQQASEGAEEEVPPLSGLSIDITSP